MTATAREMAAYLKRMALYLQPDRNRCLLIAATPDPDGDKGVAALLRQFLEGEPEIAEFTFSADPGKRLTLSQELRTLPPPERKGILLVFGLDELPPEERKRFIFALNWERGFLARSPYSTVLWVRPQTISDLRLQAADFFSWNSGAYTFEIPTDPVERQKVLKTISLYAPASLAELSKRYLEYLCHQYEWLDFTGFRQVRNVVRLRLQDIYVPLSVRVKEKPGPLFDAGELPHVSRSDIEHGDVLVPALDQQPAMLPDSPIKGTLRQAVRAYSAPLERDLPADEMMQQYQQVVLLGDPGAGKSTFLRHLTLGYACDTEAPLPALMPLREYAVERWHGGSDKGTPLADSIPDYLHRQGLPDLSPLFHEELGKGRVLFVLDGLDEMLRIEERASIAREIEALARQYPRSRVIVTSRVAGYSLSPLGGDFVEATIRDFGPGEVESFARKWCRAYEFVTGQTPEAEKRAELRASSLLEAVKDPRYQKLTANPLLLTLLALIHYQGTRLPQHRVDLYRLAVEALAETWNLARCLSGRPLDLYLGERRLDEARVVRLLAPIAFWLHENHPGGIVERPALEQKLAAEFLRQEVTDPEQAKKLAADFLDLAREQMGILVERGPGSFGFLHLTFEEYLAARHVSSQIDFFLPLKRWLHQPRWREVVLLTAGVLGQDSIDRSSQFVNNILNAGSAYDSILHRDLLLACRCLADEVPLYPELKTTLLDGLVQLRTETPYSRLRNEISDIVLNLGEGRLKKEIVERFIGCLEDKEASVRAAAAEALGAIGNVEPAVVEALLGALQDKDEVVRRAAAGALGAIGKAEPGVIEPLLPTLQDKDDRVRRAAAGALGAIGNADYATIDALVGALQDKDFLVGEAAAMALGEIAKGEPKVTQALLGALQGKDEWVRWTAAGALGATEKAGTGVIEALLAALKEENISLRWAAAVALGKIRNAAPTVIEALLRTLRDRDEGVRWAAAAALGKIGKAEAKIIETLLRACEEEHEDVRAGATTALGETGEAGQQTIRALLGALQDKSEWVRQAAARALGKIGKPLPEVMDALLGASRQKNNYCVRTAAVEALGGIGKAEPKVIGALLEDLQDKRGGLRQAAVQALGTIGMAEPRVTDAFLRALEDEHGSVRWAAAEALGKIGKVAPGVMEAMTVALQDEDNWMRKAAATALGKLRTNGRVASALERVLSSTEHSSVADAAFEALWEIASAMPARQSPV